MIAIYPGTFDPITKGHLDLIQRGSLLFKKLIVSIGKNTSKKTMFSCSERMELIQELVQNIENVEVVSFHGLVVDHAKKIGAQTILRGIRTFSDFEYEFQMALTNRAMEKEIETVFVMPSLEYSFISSHLIKEILILEGNISQFVPTIVESAMKKKLSEKI